MSRNKNCSEVYGSSVFKFDPNKSVTYVNITVLDASEAVYNVAHAMVTGSLSRIAPKSLSKKVAKRVAKSKSETILPSRIAEGLSKKLPKKLMFKVFKKTGMRISAECVFREDNFIVIQFQVQKVDSLFIIREMKEKIAKEQERELQIANGIEEEEEDEDDEVSVATVVVDEWITEQEQLTQEELDCAYCTDSRTPETQIPWKDMKPWKDMTSFKLFLVLFIEWLILNVFPEWLHRKWQEKVAPFLVDKKIGPCLEKLLCVKLEEKLLKADTTVVPEPEQARFLFDYLRYLRAKRQHTELPDAAEKKNS